MNAEPPRVPLSSRPTFPTSVLCAAIRARNAVPAATPRAPYAVERYPALNDAVHLVGYDGRGEVMVELRIPARRFTDRTMLRLQTWMRRNDEPATTPLSLV